MGVCVEGSGEAVIGGLTVRLGTRGGTGVGGDEVTFLLDTNVCPHCENSPISVHNPQCEKCGYVADQNIVSWG